LNLNPRSLRFIKEDSRIDLKIELKLLNFFDLVYPKDF
jgi:hypothetical protein